MPRNTPREMKAQARAQEQAMKNKLAQKRAEQQAQELAASAQSNAMKTVASQAKSKQKLKQLEFLLHADLKKMIIHMKTSRQHWLTAMKIFAEAQQKMKAVGVDPMSTNFYKNLSYIDDVYEGMGIFLKKAYDTLKL